MAARPKKIPAAAAVPSAAAEAAPVQRIINLTKSRPARRRPAQAAVAAADLAALPPGANPFASAVRPVDAKAQAFAEKVRAALTALSSTVGAVGMSVHGVTITAFGAADSASIRLSDDGRLLEADELCEVAGLVLGAARFVADRNQ